MKNLFPWAMACLSFSTLSAQEAPVSMSTFWTTDTVFKTPESVFYDGERDFIYVTNMNTVHDLYKDGDGFISRLKPDGTVENLTWISGLNDPKGMAMYNNKLYVGDLTDLVEIDVAKGTIVKKYSPKGAIFFNDVIVDEVGQVYVTDSFGNKVYKLKDGKLEVWLDKGLAKPNGLYKDKDRILLANMDQGKVYTVNPFSKEMKEWASQVPKADGIAKDEKGNYYVTNWDGEVYHVNASGQSFKLLDTKAEKVNAADLAYIEKYKLLVVPTFFWDKVVAFKIAEK